MDCDKLPTAPSISDASFVVFPLVALLAALLLLSKLQRPPTDLLGESLGGVETRAP